MAVTGLSANHHAVDTTCFFVNYVAVLIVMRKGRVRPCGLAGHTCQINSIDVAYLLGCAVLEIWPSQKQCFSESTNERPFPCMNNTEGPKQPGSQSALMNLISWNVISRMKCKMMLHVLYSLLDRIGTLHHCPLAFNHGKPLLSPPS